MRRSFATQLRCPLCAGGLGLEAVRAEGERILEGILSSSCGRRFPVISGIPRLLPEELALALPAEHPDFFARHPSLVPDSIASRWAASHSTQQAFGDEWVRFPEIRAVHEKIFRWYFEGPEVLAWRGLRVLDAGCGMGRFLHFARREGASVVGMDVSRAIDVVASREEDSDLVQADLRAAPFAPASYDLVYCLGVLHHLEDPLEGLRALAALVRPGGELRIYVYRSLEGEPWPRRALLGFVTGIRQITTRLPFAAVHAVAWSIAALATALFLWPHRLSKRLGRGEQITQELPLVQYAEVPFGMLVAEQFDRLVAPIEHRYEAEEITTWFKAVGLEMVSLLPGLGWRAIGRRPVAKK